MTGHYLQKKIIVALAYHDSRRFSELKPADIESKLFTYHLQQLLAAKLVEKLSSGQYALTTKGRKLGINAFKQDELLTNSAYSVLFMAIERDDGAWLMGRRRTHPLKDKIGFMHAIPVALQQIEQTARIVCEQKTGLSVEFSAIGGGFFHFIEADSVESFTNFTLLVATSVSGDLHQRDTDVEYSWVQDIDFSDPAYLANAELLHGLARAREPFFIDQTYQN